MCEEQCKSVSVCAPSSDYFLDYWIKIVYCSACSLPFPDFVIVPWWDSCGDAHNNTDLTEEANTCTCKKKYEFLSKSCNSALFLYVTGEWRRYEAV